MPVPLSLWERAIPNPLSTWERGNAVFPLPLGEGWGEGK